MKRALVFLSATLLISCSALAQSSGVQTKASAETQTKIQANKSGAKASGNASTSASANAGRNSTALSSGTTFEAVLSHSVDAKKNKPGDRVEAKTVNAVKSNGKVIIPRGAKLRGHVARAQARAKGQSVSSLGIVFDRAILKHGKVVPIHVVIQALAAGRTAASSPFADDDVMGSAGAMGSGRGSAGASGSGGLLGGAGSAVGGAAGTLGGTVGAVGGAAGSTVGSTVGAGANSRGALGGVNAAGALNSSSTGVIGLRGLSLNSAASSATEGSLIVSSTRNVHLDSGTRMLLRAESRQAAAQK